MPTRHVTTTARGAIMGGATGATTVMRYVTTDNSGWLRVKLEPSGKIVPLPQYLKVAFSERRDKRDYFKIEEGVYKGKNASVSQKSGDSSWLGKPRPIYRGPVNLTFKKGKGKLITPIGILTATTDPRNPISNGRHPVQLPDFPHDLGRAYVSRASKGHLAKLPALWISGG